ncbi:MAG: YjgN family protein [Nevskiales bacterium]
MTAGSSDFTSEQREFFKLFEIKVPPGVGREGAQRFMLAFLRDPARQGRWREYLQSAGLIRTAGPAARPIAATPRVAVAPPRATTPVRAAALPADLPESEPLNFTGSGGEYFRIWIVNLALTLFTLGIYSAWAKVRRLQYFYRHTQLAGASFDYDGDPIAILKGRFIALGLLLAYNFSFETSPTIGFATLALLALTLPWLLRNSFRFRLRHSSYRGLRFRFAGDTREAYMTFLLRPLVMFFTLYAATPWFHQRLKQYQHGNSFFGQTPFAFSATAGQFYQAYLLVAGLFIAVLAVSGWLFVDGISEMVKAAEQGGKPPDPAAFMGSFILAAVVYLLGVLLVTPLWQARMQNLVWNHTTLGEHRFDSAVMVWPLFQIQLTNFILVVLTLGLFMPWAAVRIARYRVESLALLPAGSLDDFVASQVQALGAMGEETAEMFDIDIGL